MIIGNSGDGAVGVGDGVGDGVGVDVGVESTMVIASVCVVPPLKVNVKFVVPIGCAAK
ncbi:hypothetical protein D3C74_487520 [compost metagenome]